MQILEFIYTVVSYKKWKYSEELWCQVQGTINKWKLYLFLLFSCYHYTIYIYTIHRAARYCHTFLGKEYSSMLLLLRLWMPCADDVFRHKCMFFWPVVFFSQCACKVMDQELRESIFLSLRLESWPKDVSCFILYQVSLIRWTQNHIHFLNSFLLTPSRLNIMWGMSNFISFKKVW